MRALKSYTSIEEFEREEIRSGQKIGFSLDDLYQEATYHAEQEDFSDGERKELDFDEG